MRRGSGCMARRTPRAGLFNSGQEHEVTENVQVGDRAAAPRRTMRFSLGAKFTATVLLILTATLAANTYYFVRTSTRFQEQELHERGRMLGRLISLISPQAILGF